jgi:hypothetical protein
MKSALVLLILVPMTREPEASIMRCLARVAGVFVALILGFGSGLDQARAQEYEFKQMKLTDKQVLGFIAAQKDLSAIADKLQAAGDKPDPKLQAELEAIAKKHGFASFELLDDVAANISMVMAGLDPQTGAYTDPVEAIKKELEEVRADTSIPEKDKNQMVSEMQEALKTTPPLQHKENIEVVKKHYKAIEKALQ